MQNLVQNEACSGGQNVFVLFFLSRGAMSGFVQSLKKKKKLGAVLTCVPNLVSFGVWKGSKWNSKLRTGFDLDFEGP